jgi:hypothetical protein
VLQEQLASIFSKGDAVYGNFEIANKLSECFSIKWRKNIKWISTFQQKSQIKVEKDNFHSEINGFYNYFFKNR